MGFKIQFGDEFVALTANWCLKCNSFVYTILVDGHTDEVWVYGCIECDERLLAVETWNDAKEELRARYAQLYLEREVEFQFDFSDLDDTREEGQMTLFEL